MEILYVLAMVAIFVLCITLLSTARRILRASPLSSGSLALSRIYDVERSDEETMPEVISQESSIPSRDIKRVEVSPATSRPVVFEAPLAETPMAASVRPATVPARTILCEPAPAGFMPPALPVLTEEAADEKPFGRLQIRNAIRIPKLSRQTYNYALECLLLGVSAWVLIKTQRSTLRYRSSQPSQNRVA